MGMAMGLRFVWAAESEPDLAAKSVQVDALFAEQIKADMPGAAVLVILDGKKVH